MPRDERGVVAVFRNHINKNELRSREAGRPIYDDVEVCELRFAGSKNVFVFPANSFSHWDEDEEFGGQKPFTYAERFPKQYQQFRSREHQTKSGTPLDYLPFLTDGKRAELRALNIYTAEALAVVDGAELKNLGPSGRELKNHAVEFLQSGSENAKFAQMQQQIDELMAKNQVLQQDLEANKTNGTKPKPNYDAMSDEQLRDQVKVLTGVEPRGNLPRRTLIRMIDEQLAANPGVAA